MSKKLRLLFGVGILLLGISCGDYVQAKDITTKSSLESALEDEKTELFLEKNKGKLDQIHKDYAQINILIEGMGEIPFLAYKEKETCGVYPQLIELFSAITKVPCNVYDTKESMEDSCNSIINREADLVLGITLPEEVASNDKTVIKMNEEGMRLHKLSGNIFQNSLILTVLQGQNYTKDQLSYAFWGTTMEYDSTIMGTMLAGHTIAYNTYNEMKEAFGRDEIEGMFITESKLRYETEIRKETYHGLDYSRINANEYFVDLNTSNLLSEMMSQVAVLYDQLYTKYYEAENDWMEQNPTHKTWLNNKVFTVIGSIGALVIAISIMVMLGLRQHTRRQYERMLLKIPKDDSKWEDILFVNLRNKKIQSKFGFSFYGMPTRFRKKKIPLKDMTKRIGFDFTKYYEYIMSRHKTEFVHEFELYIQGVQYHYVETGVVCGKKVVSRIYRK